MRRFLLTFLVVALVGIFIGITLHNAEAEDCATTKDRTLTYGAGHYLEGQLLKPGFDIFGYNYQAHLFNGYYCNVYLGRAGSALPPYEGDAEAYLAEHPSAASHWTWPYRDIIVNMKWNDAWLSNKDCDSDGVLDRYYGHSSYIGSGAWETNHMSGSYVDFDGKECHWTYFVKIIAVPADATKADGIWRRADGTEIGPSIWGSFAIIQELDNDPCAGYAGISYLSPARAGFGNW
jgi:hypothetical protein